MQFSFGFTHSKLVDYISIFHMPLFFFISGYFAYKGKDYSVIQQVIIKSGTLLLPLISWTILYCLTYNINIVRFIESSFGGYWFLFTLYVCFILFYLLDYISKTIKFNLFYDILLFAFSYIIIIVIDIIYNDSREISVLHNLVTYFRYFIIGYFIHKYEIISKILLNKYSYFIGLTCYIIQCYFFDHHNIILIFMGGLGAIIVLLQFMQTIKETKSGLKLSDIGQKSLAIYCIHYFLISDLSQIIHQYLDINNGFGIQLILSLTYTIIIIYACLIAEKIFSINSITNLLLLGKFNSK